MTTCLNPGSLAALGWNDFFDSCFHQLSKDLVTPDLRPARVIGEERGLFTLATARESFLGIIAGRLRYLANERLDLPAIGDWVLCAPTGDSNRAVIHSIFPRRSLIRRKQAGRGLEDQILAANVDCALIATSANAELNLARLQRYLMAARDGGVNAEIVLSKIDLCPDYPDLVERIETAAPGTAVRAVSVASRTGLDELQGSLVSGSTYVFIGSSGVGKSTLLNFLLGQEAMETGEISRFEDKGRHTTSSRHLFALPCGALVIDTPGLREFRLGEFEHGLQETYEDIVALSLTCKFTDCGHQGEPGCGVRQALEEGSLSEERWEWFLKLQKEVEYQKRRESGEQSKNSKARWKKIHKLAKQVPKRKRWNY